MCENEKESRSFEEQIARLEQIVSQLDVKLADSLALFEEGTRLAASCNTMLDQAEQMVVKLRKGPDGEPEELPFEGELL